MQIKAFALWLILLFLAACAPASSSSLPPQMQTYAGGELGLAFAYPQGWYAHEAEYPSAKNADEAAAKLARTLDSGVTFFLDLTETGEYTLRPYAGQIQELAAGHDRRVTHRRLAIPDLGTPSPAFMGDILDTLDAALAQGETVYVHGFGGIGRTGTVVGCWLVRHGLTGEQALAQIAAWRQGTPDGWKRSPETAAQRQMVLAWRG